MTLGVQESGHSSAILSDSSAFSAFKVFFDLFLVTSHEPYETNPPRHRYDRFRERIPGPGCTQRSLRSPVGRHRYQGRALLGAGKADLVLRRSRIPGGEEQRTPGD